MSIEVGEVKETRSAWGIEIYEEQRLILGNRWKSSKPHLISRRGSPVHLLTLPGRGLAQASELKTWHLIQSKKHRQCSESTLPHLNFVHNTLHHANALCCATDPLVEFLEVVKTDHPVPIRVTQPHDIGNDPFGHRPAERIDQRLHLRPIQRP